MEDIKFPIIKGVVCRALPYKKDLGVKLSPTTSIFVKGFPMNWNHEDLHKFFIIYGDIYSSKVALNSDHSGRGYGYVSFMQEDSA